jgi:hypothetical protein
MFSGRSRYKSLPTDLVELADKRKVTAVRFPVRNRLPLLGYHRRIEGQRLDHLANFYLKDPTHFWRLCDASESESPYALAVHDLVGIPRQER